jgi:hypothetical protein
MVSSPTLTASYRSGASCLIFLASCTYRPLVWNIVAAWSRAVPVSRCGKIAITGRESPRFSVASRRSSASLSSMGSTSNAIAARWLAVKCRRWIFSDTTKPTAEPPPFHCLTFGSIPRSQHATMMKTTPPCSPTMTTARCKPILNAHFAGTMSNGYLRCCTARIVKSAGITPLR